jgi:hypothetical protein
MAGAFESFVQTELPLRPFAPNDGNQESIAIRRGQGPRQMLFLDLADGQVLARVDGTLKGVALNNLETGGGGRYFVADIAAGSEQSTWTLEHNLNSFNCVVQAYQLNEDNSFSALIPDAINLLNANAVELKFSTAIAGKAVLSFVD